MELNEQEAHCVARILQGAWYGKDILNGCTYCKYPCVDKQLLIGEIKKRLTEETGVDLSPKTGGFIIDSEFPYDKFLRNANEPVKEYFRTRFANYLSSISLINGQ